MLTLYPYTTHDHEPVHSPRSEPVFMSQTTCLAVVTTTSTTYLALLAEEGGEPILLVQNPCWHVD